MNIFTSRIRKRAMLYVWRTQQVAMILNLIMLAITLPGVYYKEYIAWRFYEFGLTNDTINVLFLTLLLIFLILLIGYIYDRSRIWTEQNVVMTERNPYLVSYKLSAKEVVAWKYVWLPLYKKLFTTEDEKKNTEFLEKWINLTLEEDPDLRKDAEQIEKTVNRYIYAK